MSPYLSLYFSNILKSMGMNCWYSLVNYAVIAKVNTIPMFSPSGDSSLHMYPTVNPSTCLISVFFVTYPIVGPLDIFLFYVKIEKSDPIL